VYCQMIMTVRGICVLSNDNDSARDMCTTERHDSDLIESIISAYRTKFGTGLTNELKLFVRALRSLSFSN
jgi:hypothetical protein